MRGGLGREGDGLFELVVVGDGGGWGTARNVHFGGLGLFEGFVVGDIVGSPRRGRQIFARCVTRGRRPRGWGLGGPWPRGRSGLATDAPGGACRTLT